MQKGFFSYKVSALICLARSLGKSYLDTPPVLELGLVYFGTACMSLGAPTPTFQEWTFYQLQSSLSACLS